MAVPMSVIATSGQRPFATGTALGGLALAAARLRTPTLLLALALSLLC